MLTDFQNSFTDTLTSVRMYPSGRGPAYSGPISSGLYSRSIALTQERRSQVDDVCECVRD